MTSARSSSRCDRSAMTPERLEEIVASLVGQTDRDKACELAAEGATRGTARTDADATLTSARRGCARTGRGRPPDAP